MKLRLKPGQDLESVQFDLIDTVCSNYKNGISLRALARKMEMSPMKIRKILITGGVYETDLSIEIRELYRDGRTVPEIAYSIDYSLKKDSSMDPPRYMVFFRAKDVDVMTAAFREYTGLSMSKEEKKSVTQKLQKAIEKSISHRERDRSKDKNRGFER